MTRVRIGLYMGVIIALAALVVAWYFIAFRQSQADSRSMFEGDRAFSDVQTQVAFGPRLPGSQAHARALDWMREQLAAAGWKTRIESSASMGHPIQNLIAWRSDASPEIIVGAHYDTRLQADRDPDPNLRKNPVPGANDGASGVAVLLELARTLPNDGVPIWLVFFDAEDNGKLAGWDWILGSRAFVAALTSRPRAMILVDMVGGSDLSLPYEANSDAGLRSSIWATAASLGYGRTFIPEVKYSIEDDHLPFVEVGIPAVDIIDINYAYWHTTSDTAEHVSLQSLQIVGDVLLKWLAGQSPATE